MIMFNNVLNNMLNMVFQGQNPNQLINEEISKNPQAQILFNQMQQSGMSIKDFTLQYAKQNNINIQPYLNMFYQRGIKL